MSDSTAVIQSYLWIEEAAEDGVTLTLTAVRSPADAAELPHSVGWGVHEGDPASLDEVLEAWNEDQEDLFVFTRGDWLFFLAPSGWVLSSEESLELLAAETDAMSVYWDVNSHMLVVAARSGRVVRSFDPLVFEGDQSGDPLAEEDGPSFGDEDALLQAMMFALMERCTGQVISEKAVLETFNPKVTVKR